jgi:serine/threonine-protein kinase
VNETARALIGRTLGGRFKLTSFIGEGAMASVFRGVQSAEPREVAVKVMHRGLSEDRSFLGRFQREARAASRIDHRNTVRILEHGRDRDVVYIAMELVAGQDLFEVLVRERRLSEARAARIVLQVCAALEAAHRHGVVHRDLKPENVMLVRDPDDPKGDLVKVLDFGIAKLLERDRATEDGDPARADSVITLVGTVIGTPEYMSPEQARGRPPVDARSDVYAAGVLLYQLVTGRLPFRGESPIDVILQHIERPPLRPTSIVPGLHPGLERIILTALAKWPAERQQSAAQLAGELAAILPELLDSPRLDDPAPRSADDESDEAPPTVRMLPDETCFTPTEVGPSPAASRLSPPPPRPEIVVRRSQAPAAPLAVEPPSPWAIAPRSQLTPAQRDDALMGWWALLIAVAILCAAIWLTRYGP